MQQDTSGTRPHILHHLYIGSFTKPPDGAFQMSRKNIEQRSFFRDIAIRERRHNPLDSIFTAHADQLSRYIGRFTFS